MSGLFDSEPVTLQEMLVEANRELHLRQSVYPRRVSNGKMKQAQADRYIHVQRALVVFLEDQITRGHQS